MNCNDCLYQTIFGTCSLKECPYRKEREKEEQMDVGIVLPDDGF